MLRVVIVSVITLVCWGCSAPSKITYYQQPPQQFVTLYATGYAPIDTQPGVNKTTKILQAMRASKLAAYRELTAQVHGQQIDEQSNLHELMLTDSALSSSISGLIRGARVSKSYPLNDNMYATELELDYQRVYLLYRSSVLPRQIINE